MNKEVVDLLRELVEKAGMTVEQALPHLVAHVRVRSFGELVLGVVTLSLLTAATVLWWTAGLLVYRRVRERVRERGWAKVLTAQFMVDEAKEQVSEGKVSRSAVHEACWARDAAQADLDARLAAAQLAYLGPGIFLSLFTVLVLASGGANIVRCWADHEEPLGAVIRGLIGQ